MTSKQKAEPSFESLANEEGAEVIVTTHIAKAPSELKLEIAEHELQPLEEMQNLFPESGRVTLLRFLRARGANVELASTMYSNFLAWRNQYPTPITLDGCDQELRMGAWHFHGKTKAGHPVVVLKAARFIPGEVTQDNLARMIIYATEKIIEANPITEQCVVLVDYYYFGLANVSYEIIRWLIGLYLDYFPEILHIEFVFNTPWIFRGLWSWAKAFLDEHTVSKIVFLPPNPEDYMPSLLEYFDVENLEKWCGGISSYTQKGFRTEATAEKPFIGEIIDRKLVEHSRIESESAPVMYNPAECNLCKSKFGWFTKKNTCLTCGRPVCNTCFSRWPPINNVPTNRNCKTCRSSMPNLSK